MKPNLLPLLAASALVLVACGPSAKDVCGKLKELDAEPVACEIKWTMKKSEKPDDYKKEATCILAAKDKAEASKCIGAK